MSVEIDVLISLGSGYSVSRRDDFNIFSSLPPHKVEKCFEFAMYAKGRVSGLFPEIEFSGPNGSWDIVLTETNDDLLKYLSYITGPSFDGGIIPGDQPHFLMPYLESDTLDGALAHELIHASLRNFDTPKWVEEGLAMSVEINMSHRSSPLADMDRIKELRSFYQINDPSTVLDDDAFWAPEKSDKSYDLSFLMVSSLIRNRKNFFEFIEAVSDDDAGEKALLEIYGLDIYEFARHSIFPVPPKSFLGKVIQSIFGTA
jgi:hypothetical protein